MKGFEAREGELTAELSSFEVELLLSLLAQMDEMLGLDDVGAASSDPLAAMEAEASMQPLDRTDPLVGRLFPDAYHDDPEASSDFSRYTEFEQRKLRARDSAIVVGGLINTANGEFPLRVYTDEVECWMRTLTALRLSLATRLEIVDVRSLERLENLPADDPDAFGYSIYEWIGFALESLLHAVTDRYSDR